MRWLAILVVLCASIDARAECADQAAKLRQHLELADRNTTRWNTGWALGFFGAAVAQMTATSNQYKPLGTYDRDYEELLWVGAAKASVGFAARVVLPLSIQVPAPRENACDDLAALRGAAEKLAKKERRNFWLNHIGGMTVNLAGALVLYSRRNLKTAVTSLAIGIPVGLISTYTMPRATWHWWREQGLSITPTIDATDGGATFGIAADF